MRFREHLLQAGLPKKHPSHQDDKGAKGQRLLRGDLGAFAFFAVNLLLLSSLAMHLVDGKLPLLAVANHAALSAHRGDLRFHMRLSRLTRVTSDACAHDRRQRSDAAVSLRN